MKRMIPYLLIGAGIVSTIVGIVLLNVSSGNKKIIAESNVQPSVQPTALQSQVLSPTKTTEEISKEKGDAFEKFVVSCLNEQDFRLLEWQGDKYHNGVYPENNLNPDLVVGIKGKEKKIALECKWRSKFIGTSLKWTTEQHWNGIAYTRRKTS